MAKPTNRAEFKEYCLRKLGKPVIEINVDDDQIDDRIDEALRYYWDYHFDGTEKIYYKHQVTQQDIDNQYITLPENIIGAVSIFNVDDPSIANADIFNLRYQIALNDIHTLTSVSMVPYYMAMEKLALISEMLVGKIPIRYTRHSNKLHIDMKWSKINVGEFLLVEAYEILDPAVYTDVWNDRWLQNYATAKIKANWGANISKYSGMQLPGGVTFNGDRILDDANAEIAKMEEEMISSYSLPVLDMIA
jgi:hypothetical protein